MLLTLNLASGSGQLNLSALIIPATRRVTIGDRAFPVAAARVWNSLPQFVMESPSLPKHDLKHNF
jgi:hypothetical protein